MEEAYFESFSADNSSLEAHIMIILLLILTTLCKYLDCHFQKKKIAEQFSNKLQIVLINDFIKISWLKSKMNTYYYLLVHPSFEFGEGPL